MNFLIAFVFFVVATFISFFLGSREWHIAFIGVATIVGFLVGQMFSLSRQVKALRQALSDDWELRQANQQATTSNKQEFNDTPEEQALNSDTIPDVSQTPSLSETASSEETVLRQEQANTSDEYRDVIDQAAANVVSQEVSQRTSQQAPQKVTQDVAQTAVSEASMSDTKEYTSEPYKPQANAQKTNEYKTPEDSIADKISNAIKGYFTGGNIFVRIGIIILFFGVSFLLKYVSDRGFFPIEYRLIGVIVGAMFLLGLGWRLRHKNETYALLLQGAGIGILYLDIYAAFSMYQLIPALAAFALLFVVSMLSAALAILQDSKSLAVLGFSGGFIAPILASSGSNNHVGLFSYYAVLNVAIVVIAWFKAWRSLNLLGFAFTFIIGTAWGVLSYNSSKFATTEPFLILFFVFYVLIAVLYALRQPTKLRGYVDGTLLFGVPLAASALQYSLVKEYEYGVSISSFVMGAFYMILAWFIWKRKGEGLKLLAEAFLALGVIFASMAIPFALAPTQTAAAWALEGAGFIWLGSRQNRVSVRGFGILLQLGAGLIFLARHHFIVHPQAFINGDFISSMMLAVAGILSAYLLIKPFEGKRSWEKFGSNALLVWGLIWLIAGFVYQLLLHYSEDFFPTTMMIFISIVSLLLGFVANRTKPVWRQAWIASFTLFLLILLMACGQFLLAMFNNNGQYYPSVFNGWFAWSLVFIVYYFLLHQVQKQSLFNRFQSVFHIVLLLLIVVLITLEGYWIITHKLNIQSAWLGIWYAVPATLALWLIIKASIWPFRAHKDTYRQYAGLVLAVVLALWSFVALVDKGRSDPLPWIPVLNPLDIMLIIVFITLFKWWKSTNNFNLASVQTESNKLFNKRLFILSFAAIGFLWLNFTLFRMAYHWFDIPYDQNALFSSNLVQTSVSILWALSGVMLTLFASRKLNRLLWITGAVLLGAVVLKLFVIDLSALGSLGRIISFLVVGALLTSIGYFAPLPDKDDNVLTDNELDKSLNKPLDEKRESKNV